MGLSGAAAIAAGVTIWAVQAHSGTDSEAAVPDERETNLLLQTALLQQKYQDPQGAVSTYQRLLRLDPENKLAWYNLGVLAQQKGSTAEARTAYEKALKIDPDYASALFNEAILLKKSEPDHAAELLRRAITAQPEAPTAHLQLGLILADKDRSDDAREEFRRAVASDPSLLSEVPVEFRDSVSPEPNSSQAGSSE
ncbi:tetratricopeptide repeat protein [Streptomyces sp. NPDC086787]|uniref:tetratricopeptide repeat protein n=1 Tax=Streptomyces sp. NPDC086787 TaxID=3365759 RepID=UPI003816947D